MRVRHPAASREDGRTGALDYKSGAPAAALYVRGRRCAPGLRLPKCPSSPVGARAHHNATLVSAKPAFAAKPNGSSCPAADLSPPARARRQILNLLPLLSRAPGKLAAPPLLPRPGSETAPPQKNLPNSTPPPRPHETLPSSPAGRRLVDRCRAAQETRFERDAAEGFLPKAVRFGETRSGSGLVSAQPARRPGTGR
jgi:hypothetical protein